MLGARDTAENKAESCPRGKAQEICKKTNKTSDDVERFREQNRVVTMTEETTEWGVGPGLPGELRREEQEADSHVKIRGQSTHFPEKGEPGQRLCVMSLEGREQARPRQQKAQGATEKRLILF